MFHRSIERIKGLGWHIKVFSSAADLVELHGLFAPRCALRRCSTTWAISNSARVFPDPHLMRWQWICCNEITGGCCCRTATGSSGSPLSLGRCGGVRTPHVRGGAGSLPLGIGLAASCLFEENAERRRSGRELLYRYLPDAQERQRVLVDNPARLYGFN